MRNTGLRDQAKAGERFGRWEVIEVPNGLETYIRVCRCDCGTVRAVPVGNLTLGHSKGCNKCQKRGGKLTHGLSKSPVYKIWRLYRKRYSGQWPSEWASITEFAKWADGRPPRSSLKRYDESLPFGPDNCYWGANRKYCVNNQFVTLDMAAKRLGISRQAISVRLKIGWKPEDALSLPRQRRGKARPKCDD